MKNKNGFSLVEMLVYVGIASIVMLVGASILILSNKLKSNVSTYVGVAEIMNQIQAVLKEDAAFEKTMSMGDNSSVFSCVTSIQNSAVGAATSCYGKGGGFTLYNSGGTRIQEVARPSFASDGIDMNGRYCSSFSATSGNIRCPFRINLTWSPVCADTACTNPVIRISAALVQSFGPSGPPKDFHLSGNAYQFSTMKQSKAATSIQNCQANGGILKSDLVTGKTYCLLRYSTRCPTDTFLVGFDSQGKLKCRALHETHCQNGQVVGGFDGNGNLICNPGCSRPYGASKSAWGSTTLHDGQN
jgi:type II secretory pathway pseudopilin PulG